MDPRTASTPAKLEVPSAAQILTWTMAMAVLSIVLQVLVGA